MGCGCGAAVAPRAQPTVRQTQSQQAQITFEGCTYTVEQLQGWLTKIDCFVSKGLMTNYPNIKQRNINMYIGIVLSAVNYASNVCYFQKQLDEVQSFITVIISTGQC